MPNYSWPPMDQTARDGQAPQPPRWNRQSQRRRQVQLGRASGRACCSPCCSPRRTPMPRSPASISAKRRATPGVTAVRVITQPGTEIQWAGAEVAAVAATTEEIATDAVRKIKVRVRSACRTSCAKRIWPRSAIAPSPPASRSPAIPTRPSRKPTRSVEGYYGIPVITHCCLEPHGQTIAVEAATRWNTGLPRRMYPASAAISGKRLKVPAANIHVHMDYMGGGFGSKFPSDLWGVECAQLSKESGGKPVKLFLDRATELSIAGNRPSVFGKVKVGGKKDGTITVWQSNTWATGGIGGGGMNAQIYPYVFTNVPEPPHESHRGFDQCRRRSRLARSQPSAGLLHHLLGASRIWPRSCNMDPLEMWLKNLHYTRARRRLQAQLEKAAEMIEWKKNWHPRGDRATGPSSAAWDRRSTRGAARATPASAAPPSIPTAPSKSNSAARIWAPATRTMIAMVAAETFGLPVSAIKVKIGDSSYPNSGRLRRLHHHRRRLVFHPQSDRERARQAVRAGRSRR